MKSDLKFKFRVAILRHAAAASEKEEGNEDEDPPTPGMSFFTAVR